MSTRDDLPATDPEALRRAYRKDQGEHTLKVMRLFCVVAILGVGVSAWQDVAIRDLALVLPVRLGVVAVLLLGLLASFTFLPRRPSWVVPWHAALLAAVVTHMTLVVAYILASRTGGVAGHAGVTGALLVVEMGAFVFAAGARRHLPWILFGPLSGMALGLVLMAHLRPLDWSLLSDPLLAGVAFVAVALMQESMAFREHVARRLALERQARIEVQADELRRSRDQLEERVGERTEALQRANEALRTDIARREAAERALRESEEKYRSLVQEMPLGIAILVADPLRVAFVNPALEHLLGRSAADLLALEPREIEGLVLGDDRAVAFRRLGDRMSGRGDSTPSRVRLVRPDGEVRCADVTASRLSHLEPPAVHVVFQDVTDRTLWEGERDRLQRIESLALVAGGVAHDFNNLLTGIGGNVGLALLEAPPAGAVHQRLLQAERAVAQASSLVNQLMALARGGAPVRQAAPVRDLVGRTATLAASGSRTRLEWDFPADLWSVEVDATQVAQVVQNLVLNAVQAMADGGVLHISARNVPAGEGPATLPPGRYVQVTFRDEGPGIPLDVQPRIFDPYYTTKPHGSGLGLAVVMSVVAKHGGCVTVDSRPGSGSAFHVFLPAAAAGPAAGEAPAAGGEEPRGAGRLLVMDDEAVVREVCCQILHHLGYEADGVSSGEEAVEAWKGALRSGTPYDLVILDLTVPGGMGGRETLRALQAVDAGVRAIASSGYTTDPAVMNHRPAGFVGALAKPYTPALLARTVRLALSEAAV